MGDQQHRLALDHRLQALLETFLAGVVHGAGRFVEQQDLRVEQQGPAEGDVLALAAGEVLPTLADLQLVAVRVQAGKLMHAR
ncbi:hypothetical protein PS910_04391 [Pseudomonas fluorescens]|nr:hypothetical protein PS910_04391 [Pseudomonas fluorescens]